MPSIKFAILTVSDRCFRGEAVDKSGPALKSAVTGRVVASECVPDETEIIEEKLRNWCSNGCIDVILTTGGTGFSPRDVTPEATRNVIEKQCPQIIIAMALAGIKSTPNAVLSRGVCGIKNNTLIINLPGSKKGALESYFAVSVPLPHAVDVLRNQISRVSVAHSEDPRKEMLSKVPKLKTVGGLRESPWPMISMDAAMKITSKFCSSTVSKQSLWECLGYVTSEDIHAQDSLPPFRASTMDGYAVRSSCGLGVYKVLNSLTAGCPPINIEIGEFECVRVNTGSPVPDAADAVIPVEYTELLKWNDDCEEEIKVSTTLKPGTNVRPVGSDISQGQVVLPKGSLIRSAECGLLAAIGSTCVPVYQKPKVAVLSTGDEIVEPGINLPPGSVRDSNMLTLLSLFKECGIEAIDMGISKDDPDELFKNFHSAVQMADVIVSTGSVSMGEKDYVKDVLIKDLNATIRFGRVNMKPGKPTTFATLSLEGRTKLIFCLPGNPVSATVMSHLLVVPALKRISGWDNPYPRQIQAIIDFDIDLDERPEYRRAILDWNYDDGLPRAKSTGNQISSRLMSWRAADSLLELPKKTDERDKIFKGEPVIAYIVSMIQ